ncbi:MAG TPA: hypothetical protein G4N92_08375 [Anaerolineae bacterium]|nr:hypothetical protein [Anaerolineae bacterium]
MQNSPNWSTITVFYAVFFILLALSACSGYDDAPPIQAEINTPAIQSEQFPDENAAARKERLDAVSHWFYYLGFNPDEEILQQLAESTYDLVVLEPIFTEQENFDFPIEKWIEQLHQAPHPKLVLVYIDIGEAEEWRSYWQSDWRIGYPDWILGEDPDGREGNYPVAYWREEWQEIWLNEDGILDLLIEAGFDGVYLDWVEAYSDESVMAAAQEEQINAEGEMINWVKDIAAHCRQIDPLLVVIAQNAAELAIHDDYLAVIDAISQEQVWFDGGADNHPAGDCPLPRTQAEIESDDYVSSLSPACHQVYYQFPESTLHTSSEDYLIYLKIAQEKGVPIFTVDYALEPQNVAWVYQTSRNLGFVPFVSERNLNTYFPPYP